MLTRPRSARRRLTQQHVTRQHKDMNEYQIVRVREGDSGTFTLSQSSVQRGVY